MARFAVDLEPLRMSTFTGTAGPDALTGTADADVLDGGPGADTLDGGGGADTLIGGGGDDVLVLRPGVALADGGDGLDTVDLTGAPPETTRVDLNLVGLQEIWPSLGQSVDVIGVENVIGHPTAPNVLIGDGTANMLTGGGGDDTLLGASGDDRLEGGGGLDTAVFGADAAHFHIMAVAGRWTVTDLDSGLGLGADTATGVELFQFADLTLDTRLVDPATDITARNILRDPGAWGALVAAGIEIRDQATSGIIQAAATTSSVATLAYQFFTGAIPSAGGMDYLVSPTGPNPNNLNAPYYQDFNLENRYINFAVNLGKVGEGHAAFEAAYGGKSLFEATRSAYATIFGEAPGDTKLHALLDPTVTLGGVTMTRAEYLAAYGGDGTEGLGTKAAMVGWLLAEAVKADVGMYAKANDAFLADLTDGASFAVDLIGVYGKPEFVFHPG
jgi:Ca2+-binding RTX toxin-like protein